MAIDYIVPMGHDDGVRIANALEVMAGRTGLVYDSEAGEYTLYVALKSGFSGTLNSDRMKCSFVVENGSTRQVKTVYSFKDTANVLRVVPVTLKLEKGINEVRIAYVLNLEDLSRAMDLLEKGIARYRKEVMGVNP